MIQNTYSVLARAYASAGDSKRAYAFLDSAKIAGDSVAQRTNSVWLAGIQHKVDAENFLRERKVLEKEQGIQNLIRNGLILTLVFIGIIAALLVSRQRTELIHQRKDLEFQKSRAENDLNHAARLLAEFTGSLAEKNELIEKFNAELHRLKSQPEFVAYLENNETMKELEKTSLLTDVDWLRFQDIFEKVHSGYIEKVNKMMLGLSPVEMRFLLLSRLKLSMKEIAGILGISVESVRINIQKLGVKLGLDESGQTLVSFAETLEIEAKSETELAYS
jgi:DNA-binding CsgD family transcriptional regulator